MLASIAHPTWLVVAAYLCAVLNAIPGYLVFAHSLFDWVELKIMLTHWTGGVGWSPWERGRGGGVLAGGTGGESAGGARTIAHQPDDGVNLKLLWCL